MNAEHPARSSDSAGSAVELRVLIPADTWSRR